MLARIGARRELAGDRGLGKQSGIGGHRLHGLLDRGNGTRHFADLVARIAYQLEVEIAGGHLLGRVDDRIDRTGDAAGDKPGEQQCKEYGRGAETRDQFLGRIGHRVSLLANSFDFGVLKIAERDNSCNVFGLRLAQITLHQRYHLGLLFELDQLDSLVQMHGIGRAGDGHALEQFLALFAGNGFLQFLQIFSDDLPLLGKIAQRFLLFGTRIDKGIAQLPRRIGEGLGRIIRLHGLGKLVIDQQHDLVIEAAEPHIADAGNDNQKSQGGGKSYPQTNANFQILEHDLPPGLNC